MEDNPAQVRRQHLRLLQVMHLKVSVTSGQLAVWRRMSKITLKMVMRWLYSKIAGRPIKSVGLHKIWRQHRHESRTLASSCQCWKATRRSLVGMTWSCSRRRSSRCGMSGTGWRSSLACFTEGGQPSTGHPTSCKWSRQGVVGRIASSWLTQA